MNIARCLLLTGRSCIGLRFEKKTPPPDERSTGPEARYRSTQLSIVVHTSVVERTSAMMELIYKQVQQLDSSHLCGSHPASLGVFCVLLALKRMGGCHLLTSTHSHQIIHSLSHSHTHTLTLTLTLTHPLVFLFLPLLPPLVSIYAKAFTCGVIQSLIVL